MGEKKLSDQAMKICMEDTIQNVLDILEADNGRSFEEKQQEIAAYIETRQDELSAERELKTTLNNATGKSIKEKFWSTGNIQKSDEHIYLRAVQEADRAQFFKLQEATHIAKFMLKEEDYQDMMWKEHVQDKSMMFTIEVDGEYAGYCGINNLSCENWEIAIELLTKFRYKGIGCKAISIMLSEIKNRLGIERFRAKIDPENYASQRLIEKLGATPYGIAEYLLHKEEDITRLEEENLDEIDDQLIHVAQKFGVEPRKLLSHVLEYELNW